jgi:hypothetical protein
MLTPSRIPSFFSYTSLSLDENIVEPLGRLTPPNHFVIRLRKAQLYRKIDRSFWQPLGWNNSHLLDPQIFIDIFRFL